MEFSSRQPLGDILALLWSLVADVSHLQELIHSEWIDPEKKERYENLLLEKVDMRRAIMNELEIVDRDLRCNLKHNIESRQFASEVYYALRTPFWEEVFNKCEEHLNMILSEMLWVEITKCMRCLQDMILDSKKEND